MIRAFIAGVAFVAPACIVLLVWPAQRSGSSRAGALSWAPAFLLLHGAGYDGV
jgi:hypothetical protein